MIYFRWILTFVAFSLSPQACKGQDEAPRTVVGRRGGYITETEDGRVVTIGLSDCNVADSDLSVLAKCPDLQTLNLPENPITDAGMPALSSLKRLKYLDLSGTSVTAKGLRGELSPLVDLSCPAADAAATRP
jgi:hypothetical protein